MMKRKLLLSGILMLVLVLCFGSIALARTPDETCPICGGALTYEYESDDFHWVNCAICDDVIDKLSHNFVTDSAVTATCEQTGLTEGKHCSDCGFVIIEQSIVPKLPHTVVVDAAVPATCTSTGLTEGSHCSVCNAKIIEQQPVPKLPHTEGEWEVTKAATCTMAGERVKRCTRCNALLVREVIPIDPQAHEYTARVTPPTCAKDGFTTFTCVICGNTYTGDKTTALPHWYGEWTPYLAGTHSAVCRRTGCGHRKIEKCEYSPDSVNGMLLSSYCTICYAEKGTGKSAGFQAIQGATAVALGRGALLRGDVVAFKIDKPFGEDAISIPGLPEGKAVVSSAFNACIEVGGRTQPLRGRVRFTLPWEPSPAFRMGRLDQNNQWLLIPHELKNGTLCFDTDSGGLFMTILP